MLGAHPLHPTVPAADLERAKRFYGERLGLTVESEAPEGVFYSCAGTKILVYPSAGMASGSHTQVGWAVDDIEAEVAELKSRGVVFEEYDSPDLQTVNSIALTGSIKAAWFKDSEGNMLALGQFS